MNHLVFKQRWEKPLPSGEVEVVNSIHLSPDSARIFMEKEKNKPTHPNYSPIGCLMPWEINDDLFEFLLRINGIWTEGKPEN